MIKTVETIIFNKFVVPSCIDDLQSERNGLYTDWTVAGYGEVRSGQVPIGSVKLVEMITKKVNFDQFHMGSFTYYVVRGKRGDLD